MNTICRLCKKEKELVNSHIIPKFIISWLKDTSVTGRIRMGENPNIPRQDGIKIKLLCKDCENLFSKWEKAFSENIFHPYLSDKSIKFEYDSWLVNFISSLSWRVIILHSDYSIYKEGIHSKEIHKAEENWRNFLIGNREFDLEYDHHLYFVKNIRISNLEDWPDNFYQYLHRNINVTIASNSVSVNIYVKLPGMIIWSAITPKNLEGWKGTRIEERGLINEKYQEIHDHEFYDMLKNDMEMIQEELLEKVSERQIENANKRLLANPERAITYQSLELYLLEKSIKEKKRVIPKE